MKKYLLRSPLVVETLYRLTVLRRQGHFDSKRSVSSPLQPYPVSSIISDLRRFLRNCPNWLRGHIRLGEAAIDALETAPRDQANRLLATAELSVDAIEALTSGENSARLSQSVVAEAKLVARTLESNLFFFRQMHAEALHLSEEILASSQAQLSEQQRLKLFEQAGAAALSLGIREKAKLYFTSIPANLRTAAGIAALDYLRHLEEEQNP